MNVKVAADGGTILTRCIESHIIAGSIEVNGKMIA
jgi:hypothetical protein